VIRRLSRPAAMLAAAATITAGLAVVAAPPSGAGIGNGGVPGGGGINNGGRGASGNLPGGGSWAVGVSGGSLYVDVSADGGGATSGGTRPAEGDPCGAGERYRYLELDEARSQELRVAWPVAHSGSFYRLHCGPTALEPREQHEYFRPGSESSSSDGFYNRARHDVVLNSPDVFTSPRRDQLVRVPTWFWLDAGRWVDQTASAGPVTATATPIYSRWAIRGEGTFDCPGPGTPYTSSSSADQPSPDCGRTFTRSAAGQPDEVFSGTATIHYRISITVHGQDEHGNPVVLEQRELPDVAGLTLPFARRVAEGQALGTDVR
jgi:hypothetical protein